MISHESQKMCITYYNRKKRTAITSNFLEYFSLIKKFIEKYGYGLYCSSPTEEIYCINPTDTIENKLKTIKYYLDSLTNKNNKDFLKYENNELYFMNKRKQLVWMIDYINPILENRQKIYDAMFNYDIVWKFSFQTISNDIFNLAFKLLVKKYSNKTDSEEYQNNLKQFKMWNLNYSMNNEISNDFYFYIQNLLNLQSMY